MPTVVVKFDLGFHLDTPGMVWGDPVTLVTPDPPRGRKKKGIRTMANNETPDILEVLCALARDIAGGLHTIQATIGMSQNTEAKILADLKPLEGDPAAAPGSAAFKGSILVYDEAQSTNGAAENALALLNDGDVYEFLIQASDVLGGILGRRWNDAWLPTGFPGNSTAVPRTQDARYALLFALKNYFTANPTHELIQPPHPEVSAARALSLHTQMTAARALVNTTAGAQEAAKNDRTEDKRTLFKRVSGTIAELRQVLPGDSPQWEVVGLNIPDNPTPPEAVGTVTLAPAGTNRALASWEHARRAERYRPLIQIVGVDLDFRALDTVKDLNVILKDLPPAATVRVKINAVNEAGDAPSSSEATIVMP